MGPTPKLPVLADVIIGGDIVTVLLVIVLILLGIYLVRRL